MRWIFRFPIVLYRLHLGLILGERFLMLTHTGRKSGKRRHVIVEVVDHDEATDTFHIVSGWGEKSDWFQNIQKNSETEVDVGNRHFATLAKRLSMDEAQKHMETYARKHPFAFRQLSGIMLGEHLDPTAENLRKLAEKIPMVALPFNRIS